MAVRQGRSSVGGGRSPLPDRLRASTPFLLRLLLLLPLLVCLLPCAGGATASSGGVATIGGKGMSLEEEGRRSAGGGKTVRPDVWAYNEAMSKVSSEPGGFRKAVEIFEGMKGGGIDANAVSIHCLLDAAIRSSDTRDAAEALEIFHSTPPSLRTHHTYAAAIRLLISMGRSSESSELVLEAKKQGLQPDADMLAASMAAATIDPTAMKQQQRLPSDALRAGNDEEEEMDSDEDVGSSQLRETDIDWKGRREDTESPPSLVLEIEKGQVSTQRLDQYLAEKITFMSRSAIQRLIKEGCVVVADGKKAAKPAAKLRGGDVICVYFPPPPGCKDIEPNDIPIHILHEDDSIVLVNKQPGLTVHPWQGVSSGTLVNALAFHFQRSKEGDSLSSVGATNSRPGIVHRLDRFTSGVMVVAKSDLAHWRLAENFAQRKVDKRYLAVVHGRVNKDEQLIDAPIGRDVKVRERMCVREGKAGKQAKTICRVRERYKDFTLVELQLLTGRTHQIRVHLSHIGHSIAGDTTYGGKVIHDTDVERGRGEGKPILVRQALHATCLSFEHPITREMAKFTAPLFEDMKRLIRGLRNDDVVQRTTLSSCIVDMEAIGL